MQSLQQARPQLPEQAHSWGLFFIFDLPAEEQAEPGSERQAAAAERQPEQEEPRGGGDGPTAGRASAAALEEEGGPAAEGEPWRGLQSGGSGAVHPVIFHNMLSRASGAGPPGCSGEAGVPGWHCHPAHARLVPEATSQTGQTSLRFHQNNQTL